MEITRNLVGGAFILGPCLVIFLLVYNINKKTLNAYDVLLLFLPFFCWILISIFFIAGSRFKVQTLANAVFEPLIIGTFIAIIFGVSTVMRKKRPGKVLSVISLILSCIVAIGVGFLIPTIRE